MKIKPNLVESQQFIDISGDALKIYIFFRNQIENGTCPKVRAQKLQGRLCSTYSVTDVCNFFNYTRLQASREINVLIKRKWVKKTTIDNQVSFFLGIIEDKQAVWLLDKALVKEHQRVVESNISKTLRQVREKTQNESRVTTQTKQNILQILEKKTIVQKKKTKNHKASPSVIKKHFETLYYAKYNRKAPHVTAEDPKKDYQKTYAYIKRVINWSKSGEEVLNVLDFIFDKWADIQEYMGIKSQPSWNFLSSSKVWPQFLQWYEWNKVPKRPRVTTVDRSITHRYDASTIDDENSW